MYKRCITDKNEKEPKKLFYLVQFLMFDKEDNKVITEENTLELLIIRHKNDYENVLINIFGELINNKIPSSKDKKIVLRKDLTFAEYIDRMNMLALNKRNELASMKKNYCDYIPKILLENQKK